MLVTIEQGVQGDAVLLPGSGERCPGDSVKGTQFTSLLARRRRRHASGA